MPTHDLTTVEGILSALSINPAWSPDRREEAINLECAKHNALVEIADALNCASPSSIARAREIVSAVWALKHKSPEVAAVAQHDGGLVEELKAKIASNIAEAAARDMRIADLERDLSTKDDALKTANAALTRICEVIGAPVPVCPEDAVEAVKGLLCESEGHNDRADRAEATLAEIGRALAEIGRALADAGAPKVYNLADDTERPIPDPERIRLLGERIHTLRAQVREAADATNYLDALIEAHNALDGLRAPRLADGCVLSPAARIRSLPRWPRNLP